MIDSWQFRSNDTSADKNSRSSAKHDRDYEIARNATAPWLATGRAVIPAQNFRAACDERMRRRKARAAEAEQRLEPEHLAPKKVARMCPRGSTGDT